MAKNRISPSDHKVKLSEKLVITTFNPAISYLHIVENFTSSRITVTDFVAAAGIESGTGDVATDTIWAAVGDLVVGTGVETADILSIGASLEGLRVNAAGTALEWATLAGSGDVIKVATPVNNEIGVWTGDGTLEGDTNLQWDGIGLSIVGNLTVDTPTFYVDASDGYIGMGSVTSNTDNQLHLLMDASKDILIDGSTNTRLIDTGVIRFEQTPAVDNTRCITLNINAASQNNTHAVVVNMVTTNIAANEKISAYDVNIDSNGSSGGVARAFEVSQAGSGSIETHALHVDVGVFPLSHFSGSITNVEQGWQDDSGFTDTTTAFNSTGTDITIFDNNGAILYWGMASTFTDIFISLGTVASNPGIKPVFEFSDGIGGWTVFTPVDETQGFRQTGLIEWTVASLSGWATDTVNAVANKYWIRITRTQANLGTSPIEDSLKVSSTIEYGWDADGIITSANVSGTNTGDQTSIVGITGTKAQFDTAVTDGNFMYIGDAPTAHTHLLAVGATDVTATFGELNLLDLTGLTTGWVLSADSAATASWKAPGDVATDTIWDNAADLVVGSGANTAVKLAKGTALQLLRMNVAATSIEWADEQNLNAQRAESGATYSTLNSDKDITVRLTNAGVVAITLDDGDGQVLGYQITILNDTGSTATISRGTDTTV